MEGGIALAGIGDHFGEGYLAGRGIQDVLAPNNVRDTLGEVVDADGELIGPVTVAVTDRKIATLFFRVFVKGSEALVTPFDYFV